MLNAKIPQGYNDCVKQDICCFNYFCATVEEHPFASSYMIYTKRVCAIGSTPSVTRHSRNFAEQLPQYQPEVADGVRMHDPRLAQP